MMDRYADRDFRRYAEGGGREGPYEGGRGRDYGRMGRETEWDRPVDQRFYDRGSRYDRGGYRRGRGTGFDYEETYRPERGFELEGEAEQYERSRSARQDDYEYYRGTAGNEGGRGPYAGFGPQNYQRSDERIRHEVCERLTDHGWIDASGIEVSAEDREVTLKGTVDSRRTKRLADQIANTVTGVRDVHNRLTIRRSKAEASE